MILIGCPIYKREWILPYWFHCLERQTFDIKDVGFIFEAGVDDKETIDFLVYWKKNSKNINIFDIEVRDDLSHHSHVEGSRRWTYSKYENMVSMRNSLLDKAKEIKPDYYYSLDSDILLTNPYTIEVLVNNLQKKEIDAINTLMFMTPFGVDFPSVMSWIEQQDQSAYRHDNYPIGTLFKSDIIMAAKMMSKKVYMNSRYRFHPQGEDLGWSLDCREKEYNLYCASNIYTPHIMGKQELSNFIKEGDNRHVEALSKVKVFNYKN